MKNLEEFKLQVRKYAEEVMPYYEFYFEEITGHYLLEVRCYGNRSVRTQRIFTYMFSSYDLRNIKDHAKEIVDNFKTNTNILPSNRPHLVKKRARTKLLLLCTI